MQPANRRTPELQSVLDFLHEHPNLDGWPAMVPSACSRIQRLASMESSSIERCLAGEGTPALITDALASWPALSKWSFDFFKRSYGALPIRANDRAPARHADHLHGNGGVQRSASISLAAYIEQHVEKLPPSLTGYAAAPPVDTPYYLNGWRAFVEAPALALDCPSPLFAAGVDNTEQLLEAVDAQLFGKKSAAAAQPNTSNWCRQVSKNLSKVFMGPAGTVTRLHFDAGEAHGWLGQCIGRKLFVLFPPRDGSLLSPLASEKETEQSPIDPLHPDLQRWPSYTEARPLACIVHPGEALLVPRGWWHYAVALDKSITVQRNFYHATTNAGGLVRLVLKTASSLRTQQKQG